MSSEREPGVMLAPAWLWMGELSSEHRLPAGRRVWLLKPKPDVLSVLRMKGWSLVHCEAEK